MALLPDGAQFAAHRLAGGVSCDVWKIQIPGRDAIVVKRALSRLRVAAPWRAPPQRSSAEVAWLKLAGEIDPDCVPAVLGEDRGRHAFAMTYLDLVRYPLWKAELAAGRVQVQFAARTGEKLARIHSHTAGRDDIARAFANDAQFHALRLEPYLLYTAGRHPEFAPAIRALADGIAGARIALMQGDISPKNILCGADGPIFLDAETACYGDPAFDLAFCLNHLLLKCVWHREHVRAYLQSFRALKDAYLVQVNWEAAAGLQLRAARVLPALLLARVDGKSPVEYLTDARDREMVRQGAMGLLKAAGASLDEIAGIWDGVLAR
ncbi:MAG TPA: aminoglycoside phosphotransferase family protein [Steroidobacteraceae bacterium]|nr:aminoglycoside phosphotransferase family protein [Steroidobacteraceae bacterium]